MAFGSHFLSRLQCNGVLSDGEDPKGLGHAVWAEKRSISTEHVNQMGVVV